MTEPRSPDPPGSPERGRRRAKGSQRRTGWFPGRTGNEPRKPILPNLPDHAPTGVIARLTPEQLQARGIDPDTLRRRTRLPSRTLVALLIRWRYFVSSTATLALTIALIAGGLIVFRDSFNDSNKLPSLAEPSLEQLNQSIERGQGYLNALFKALPQGQAVQSEASGVPLRAHFLDEGVWVLLGEDKKECTEGCNTTTSVTFGKDSESSEDYGVTFSTPKKRNALELAVRINWAYSKTQFQLELDPKKVEQRVELWLDTKQLGTLAPDDSNKIVRALDSADQSQLRMLRFTVRHATQEAYLYWNERNRNPERAAALRKFLESNGFAPGFDLRAPLFGAVGNLPDDLEVNDKSYPDCDRTPPGNELAYAYRSRVCLYQSAYIVNGERDPLLQAWAALTVLMKYGNPNRKLPTWGWWTQGSTPKEVADHLRGQWNRSGYGIPKCTPFSCAELSGIRTAVFGALMTQLGYVYGDESAKRFADAAAKIMTMAQIGADGRFQGDNGNTYYRPGQAGGFLTAWVPPKLQFTEPSTPRLVVGLALLARGADPTPVEYEGIIPSNSETSLDAVGFLSMYRCLARKLCA